MRLLNSFIVLCLGFLVSAAAPALSAAPSDVAPSDVALRGSAGTSVSVSYGGKTTTYSAADLSKLPHREVAQFDMHDKKDHAYSGVLVADLLAAGGMHSGEKFRGRDLRQVVLVHCRDRYEVVFALADFNPEFGNRTIILADRRDGHPLPASMGPYRLIVSGDKGPSRSAHGVTSLEVLSVGDSTGR